MFALAPLMDWVANDPNDPTSPAYNGGAANDNSSSGGYDFTPGDQLEDATYQCTDDCPQCHGKGLVPVPSHENAVMTDEDGNYLGLCSNAQQISGGLLAA